MSSPKKPAKKFDPNKCANLMRIYFCVSQIIMKELDSANVVGTYAEWLVCCELDLKKAKDSNKDFDATKGEKKYQIKSRWKKSFLKGKNGQNEFGSIPVWDKEPPFDYLILVYFVDAFTELKVYQIEASNILKIKNNNCKCLSIKNNRFIFRHNESFISLSKEGKYIEDISDKFTSVLKEK